VIDALVDLPFALPTAVAGITLATLYAGNGWIGRYLEPLGLKIAFAPPGIVVALTFIGLPFVVRTLQPVIEDIEPEVEEAAASLGASRLQTFVRVLWPALLPALLTGFTLAFSRSIGEYGSVIFIAGNMPLISEITPLLIISKLEQYDVVGATALAVVMLFISFRHALRGERTAVVGSHPPRYRGGRRSAAVSVPPARRRATAEPAWLRHLLLAVGLGFLFFFLLLPLLAVFAEAFAAGGRAYLEALQDP
jgi:ABC-type sulfate transport system permease component